MSEKSLDRSASPNPPVDPREVAAIVVALVLVVTGGIMLMRGGSEVLGSTLLQVGLGLLVQLLRDDRQDG